MQFQNLRAVGAAVAVAIALTIGGFTLAVNVGSDGSAQISIDVPTGTRVAHDQVIKPDQDTEVDASQKHEQGATGVMATAGIHEDLKDEQPPGAPAAAAQKVVEQSEDVPTSEPQLPAGAQNYSCPFNGVVNHSARASDAKVTMFVLHYTVSSHDSLWAIYRLFNTPSFGASSHLILQPNGFCRQIVRFNRKAWTQGAFNSVSESVEITAMGTESRAWWLKQKIIKRGILASIVRDRLRARGLPLRFVNPVGCTPKAGWTDHNALECGNNHHDVEPTFPYDVVDRQIRLGVFTPTQRRCRELKRIRAKGQRGTWTGVDRDRARALKRVLGSREARCR